MRRRDKLKSIERANLLAEQRHLESKGVLTEALNADLWDFTRNTLKQKFEAAGFQVNLASDGEQQQVAKSTEENPKVLGIIWNSTKGASGPYGTNSIVLMYNAKSLDKVMSVLSKFQFAKQSGEGQTDKYGKTRQVRQNYNDGDLVLTDGNNARTKVIFQANSEAEVKADNSGGDNVIKKVLKAVQEGLTAEGLNISYTDRGVRSGSQQLSNGEILIHDNGKIIEIAIPSTAGEGVPQKVEKKYLEIKKTLEGEGIKLLQKYNTAGFNSTDDDEPIKVFVITIKSAQESNQQGDQQQLGENISGVDYISVEIKHDNGETSVKGRVEPTDIGFVIYNENNNGKPFNIVWKEKLNKFVSGESMWYDEQDVVATSGYEDAFSELKAS